MPRRKQMRNLEGGSPIDSGGQARPVGGGFQPSFANPSRNNRFNQAFSGLDSGTQGRVNSRLQQRFERTGVDPNSARGNRMAMRTLGRIAGRRGFDDLPSLFANMGPNTNDIFTPAFNRGRDRRRS